MSYARFRSLAMAEQDAALFGTPVELSDVYVYADVGGYLCCCGCLFAEDISEQFETVAEMVEHLEAHIAVGHAVPARTIPQLLSEAAELDAWIAEKKVGAG